jgi:autotransporter-associated beta strand protein
MARHYSPWRLTSATLTLLMAAAWTAQNTQGQTTYTFATQSSPTTFVDWHDPTVWNPSGIPNAPGDAAIFNRPTVIPSVPFTVIVNQNTTVGSITVNNAGFNDNHNLILDIGGTLTFQSTSGPATLTETAGSNTSGRLDIQPDITLLSDLVITQDNRADLNSSSFLRGVITGASNRTITKEGLANVQLESHLGSGFQGQYIINNGGLRFLGDSNISQSTGVTVDSDGQLQFNANTASPTYDWSLAAGAVLNLNGTGKTGGSAPDGALRFQGQAGQANTHARFNSPVVLQSDARLAAGPASVTGELTNIVSGSGGLIKSSPGPLILSNANNSYTGDTSIVGGGGMLSITNPFLADGADVLLVTGTTLNLNFVGTDVIDSFFIDGVSQAVGAWGATGNLAADFQTDLITGNGLLGVTTLVVPGVPGDYNDDGSVDAADYVIWRKNEGTTNTLPNDNGIGGTIGTAHYDLWVANFGNPPGSGSGALAAVPEPSASLLAVFALGGLLAMAIRR